MKCQGLSAFIVPLLRLNELDEATATDTRYLLRVNYALKLSFGAYCCRHLKFQKVASFRFFVIRAFLLPNPTFGDFEFRADTTESGQ